MSWQYEITTGKLYDPTGAVVGTGYAGGECGQQPQAVNNPSFVGVKDVGPLPPGWYTRGIAIDSVQLGPLAIPLIPDETNEMYGRSGFFMHGDTTPPGNASDGCIVQEQPVREFFASSADSRLRVVVTLAENPIVQD